MHHEESIVWLDDPARYVYLREMTTNSNTKKRKPKWNEKYGKMVAFATLNESARGVQGLFSRRVWVFRDTDPYPIHLNYPAEAKVPETIKAKCLARSGRSDLGPSARN